MPETSEADSYSFDDGRNRGMEDRTGNPCRKRGKTLGQVDGSGMLLLLQLEEHRARPVFFPNAADFG
jgi:hypothetical protein